ncbi:MAG TPA: hypothetical protein VKV04_06355 [Verrucomicrobiae bacterium]|nr:hypothetical protein [Verrucomicrobiae bacterium]
MDVQTDTMHSFLHTSRHEYFTTPQRPDMGVSVAGRSDYFGDCLYAFCFAFIFVGRRSFHGFSGFDGEDSSLLGVDLAPVFEDRFDICKEASA